MRLIDRVARAGFAAFAACILAFPAAAQERHRAAGVDYELVSRPGWLPASFTAPDGVDLQFLAIHTIDDYRMDAALWQPKGAAPEATPLVINVHGSGGNFHSGGVTGFASPALAQNGYAALSINTRQHDGYIYSDNFYDIRKDIEAAVWTARALKYRSIVLHGFSLGSIQVQFYAASDWSPDIKGVAISGAFANLAWKTRYVVDPDQTNYRALYDTAEEQLRAGKAGERMPVEMNLRGRKPMPMSAQHFLTYRWDGTSVADGTFWIKRIPRPVLIVHDQGDPIVADYEPEQLYAAAKSDESIVPAAKFVSLPNPKGVNAGGHGFTDNRETLIRTLTVWLKEIGLEPAPLTPPVAAAPAPAAPAAGDTASNAKAIVR
jgi:dienelactone hydrolase